MHGEGQEKSSHVKDKEEMGGDMVDRQSGSLIYVSYALWCSNMCVLYVCMKFASI